MANEEITSFAQLRLSDSTLQAISRMDISIPTPIQAAALPSLLDGRDLIGQARTGSGKTLAFGIPAVEIVDTRLREVQVLVLTPTRELAVQVGGVLDELGRSKGVKTGLIFGGRAMGPQRLMLRAGVHVVVGTPGRVLDLLNQGALRLDKVRFLVLDEADEMLDRGFAPDVERILGRTTPDRQTSLFSATVPDWVRKTSTKHLNRPVEVAVDPNPEDAAPIEHFAYDVPGGDKLSALRDLLDHRGEGSIIVFGRTKHGVKKLARQLAIAGYPVAALQGNLSQNARDQVMADFRSGAVPILLATNVAARGLDVTHVSQVVNVDLPESSDLLTHRIGRTGRMGRPGQAITLLGHEDGAKWRQLERGLGRRIPRAPWPGARSVLADPTSPPPAGVSSQPLAPPSPASPRTRLVPPSPPRAILSAGADEAEAHLDRRHAHVNDTDSRSLVTTYGRDPRRPAWKGRDTSGAQPMSARPAQPAANGHLHAIECADCGQAADVPFRPDPTRPVYCSDCFRKRGRRPRRSSEVAVVA